MGNFLSRFKNKDVRIILLGLDSAGKTTILYRLKLDDLVTTIPTIGFNVENIHYKDLHFTAWDIGSRDKIRPLFRHYYKGADAVVFVIDSHDPERLDELNYDVIKPAIHAEELTSAVFLFLANKIDLGDTMSTEEIAERLGLKMLKHAWEILPVSAVSGEGLTAALDWLAVRLGSSQVRARTFAQPPPHPAVAQTQSNTGSSLSSSSSNTLSGSRPGSKHGRTVSGLGHSREASQQKPLILVNSQLLTDNSAASNAAAAAAAAAGPSSSSASPYQAASGRRASSYSMIGQPSVGQPMHSHIRRSTPNVMNTFSSYSIAQNMKEDMTRRKLSTISRSDIRKLSQGSLLYDQPGRKFSTVSLLDSPTSAMNRRKHSSASLIIESPCYFRKLSTLSLSDTPPNGRKMSSVSLQDNTRRASAVAGPTVTAEPKNPHFLSVTQGSSFTPPIGKRQGSESSLGGFGSFSPIMANYAGFENDRKDSDASSDSIPIVSPSDHIQPHLKPLGLKKSPFLSNSGKYTVNETPPPPRGLEYDDNLSYLLPERYKNLYLAAENLSGVSPRPGETRQSTQMDNIDLSNGTVETTGRKASEVTFSFTNERNKKYSIFSRGGRLSKQWSEDNNPERSAPSSPAGQSKRSHLNFFCSPARKLGNISPRQSNRKSNNRNRAIVPAGGGKNVSCSRAYSAIKCLFFRPGRRTTRRETNSSSSEDDGDRNHE